MLPREPIWSQKLNPLYDIPFHCTFLSQGVSPKLYHIQTICYNNLVKEGKSTVYVDYMKVLLSYKCSTMSSVMVPLVTS